MRRKFIHRALCQVTVRGYFTAKDGQYRGGIPFTNKVSCVPKPLATLPSEGRF